MDIGEGPLRVAVKDCIDVAGFPTRGGSRALADATPAPDHADVVVRLLAGPCRIVGKANMHELAYGVTGVNGWTGTPVNPLFPDLVPGGSSSGSAAAVAGGLVDFAIGSDTGGSIRTPAACCGVFGLKPSFGRISRRGAYPAQTTLDVLGPLAADMDMIETTMEIIAPGFRRRLAFAPRVGLIQLGGVVDAPVATAFAAAIGQWRAPDGVADLPQLAEAFDANLAIIAAETYAAFGHLLDSGLLGADVQARLTAAGQIGAERLAQAEATRARFRAEVDAALADFDVLLLPTMPCYPLRLDQADDAVAALQTTALVRPFNLSGHPALTVPFVSAEGLPVGIQIVGRLGDDETVCAVGRMIAAALPTLTPIGERT
jgi:amidase